MYQWIPGVGNDPQNKDPHTVAEDPSTLRYHLALHSMLLHLRSFTKQASLKDHKKPGDQVS